MLYLTLWLHVTCSLSGLYLSTRQVDIQNMWTPSQYPQPIVLISQRHCLVPTNMYVEFIRKSRFSLTPSPSMIFSAGTISNILWHYRESPDIINCDVSMFSTGTFQVCYKSCTHIIYIKNCICYSSKKIMRDKAI